MTLANEIAKILLDDEWHSTSQITILTMSLIRPEIAWRRARRPSDPQRHKLIYRGCRMLVYDILYEWLKLGKIIKRNMNGHVEWKVTEIDWFREKLKEV